MVTSLESIPSLSTATINYLQLFKNIQGLMSPSLPVMESIGPRPGLVTTACSELGAMRILDILRVFRRVCLLACLFTFESFLFYSPFCCRTTHRSSSSSSEMLGLQHEPTSRLQLGFKPFLCASSPLHPLPSNLCGLTKAITSLLAPQSRFPAITGYNSGFYSHLTSFSGCPIM